ncbi:YccF domain-containing protein [Salsipaludibacter albus]|uniref:YccF domain-containing protein n=1 Tax=Salsipaludibacter albus TaxID=2849650 RepID=UPI001EE3C13C|nr:YccF domain-containing protein [Salsipaludibacter albus]
MNVLLNLLWLVLAGWWLALLYVVAGVINIILIITIPAGIQSFKLAGFALWPFGRAVVPIPGRSPTISAIMNIIWLFTGGFWLAVAHVIAGVLLMITIIGIPLGVASMKMAGLALVPFGKQVVDRSRVTATGDAIVVGG